MNDHKALDLPCEGCGVGVGEHCPGHTTCQLRINAAVKATREANKRAKAAAAKQG